MHARRPWRVSNTGDMHSSDASHTASTVMSSRPRLADRELDVNTMSLKEVIRWQGARERAKLAEERRLRVRGVLPKPYDAA